MKVTDLRRFENGCKEPCDTLLGLCVCTEFHDPDDWETWAEKQGEETMLFLAEVYLTEMLDLFEADDDYDVSAKPQLRLVRGGKE